MWDRILLYGLSAAAVGVLAWFGFFWTPPPAFEVRMDSVLEMTRMGDLDAARAECAALRNEFPDDVRGPLLLGFVEECNGELQAAHAAYLEAAPMSTHDQQRFDILLSVADLDRRMGRIVAAENRLAEVVEEAGESPRSRHLRIMLAIGKGNRNQALSELALLADENPANPIVPRLRRLIQRQAEGQPSNPDGTTGVHDRGDGR